MTARRIPAALCLALLLAMPGTAGAQQEMTDPGSTPVPGSIVADLSSHLIAITSDFAGTDLLVFGAVEGPGDIIVVVRGPRTPVVVRKKDRVAGIWLNVESVTFNSVPQFYAVAATRPLEEFAGPSLLKLNEIGVDNLKLDPEAGVEAPKLDTFRQALVDLKHGGGLYAPGVGKVDVAGGRLFRTTIRFSTNVPVGTYIADIYLVQEGTIVSAQTSPLVVSKAGFGAEVYDFAHEESAAYGLLAVLVAAMAGFLGNLMFRRP